MKEGWFFGSGVLLSYRAVIYGTFDDCVCKGTVLLPDGTQLVGQVESEYCDFRQCTITLNDGKKKELDIKNLK